MTKDPSKILMDAIINSLESVTHGVPEEISALQEEGFKAQVDAGMDDNFDRENQELYDMYPLEMTAALSLLQKIEDKFPMTEALDFILTLSVLMPASIHQHMLTAYKARTLGKFKVVELSSKSNTEKVSSQVKGRSN